MEAWLLLVKDSVRSRPFGLGGMETRSGEVSRADGRAAGPVPRPTYSAEFAWAPPRGAGRRTPTSGIP